MGSYRWVALGGAAGTLLRVGVNTLFPLVHGLHTVWINIVGSLLLAILFTLMPAHEERTRRMRLSLGTGLLGGFTTMSTFSLDVVKLLEAGEWGLAGFVIIASMLGGLLAALLGVWIGRRVRGENG